MKEIITLIIFSSFTSSNAQNFASLSKPEKIWVIRHPFSALKIKSKIKLINSVLDKNYHHPDLDTFINGGKADAFRHIYCMCYLSGFVKKGKLKKLGEAHEKGNYNSFLKSETKHGEFPDSISTIMDLHNNTVGLEIKFTKNPEELIQRVIETITSGKALVVKRDKEGKYIDCISGDIIAASVLKKWNNTKCLIAAN